MPVFLALYLDGSIAPGTTDVDPQGAHAATFTLDTTLLENGLVSVSPVAVLKRNSDGKTYYRQIAGIPRWLAVQNYITFGQIFDSEDFVVGWRDFFGACSMSLQGYSTEGSFEYELSVKNLGGTEVVHFGPSACGYDPNHGVWYFSEEWDLTTGGEYQPDDEFDVQVTAYFPAKANPTTTFNQQKRVTRDASLGNWPPYAGWIIAAQDYKKAFVNPRDNLDLDRAIINGFAFFEYSYAIQSVDPQIPIPAGYNEPEAKAFWLNYGRDTSQSQREDDWATLRMYVRDGRWRNLYLDSHGTPSMVGGDYDADYPDVGFVLAPNSSSHMTAQYVREWLNTTPVSSPYRFVFLDGCETAVGPFPDAFGITTGMRKRKLVNLSFYKDSQGNYLKRPSAFMGWTIENGFGGLGINEGPPMTWKPLHVWKGFVTFRQKFFDELKKGRSFKEARKEAAKVVNNKPEYYVYFGGKTRKIWDKGLVQYGYSGLWLENYNEYTDVWW